jgi:hypothetical protein
MKDRAMNIPCTQRLFFIVTGLSFLQPALTNIQFNNLTLVATALVLGSSFSLTCISRMWLKEKCVSTLSYFFTDAKIRISEVQNLYAQHAQSLYTLEGGNYVIDDTMKHHTFLCKCIHGVCVLFDHALKTNLKAICIVVLYYSDDLLIKFPIDFRIYYKEQGKPMPWQRRKEIKCKKKYELAIEMIEWALKMGFPKGIVLADSWFGIGPFVKEVQRLKLSYVLEIKSNYNVNVPCKEPRLTKTGKLAKNQIDKINLPKFFQSIVDVVKCGFPRDMETGKEEKVLYHLKISTVRLNSLPGKHRIVQSFDPAKKTTKYLLTNELTWEGIKIVTVYCHRWVIEEFFRNAKQLLDMEGATIRSEQGVTLALCLVSWIDFLLHLENWKQCTAGKLSKESLTIPSIIRQAQFENLKMFQERIKNDTGFIERWIEVEKDNIERKRKGRKELVVIEQLLDSGNL